MHADDALTPAPQKHRIGLKGPMATPIGKGHRSLNLTLRKELLVPAPRPAAGHPSSLGHRDASTGYNSSQQPL